MCSIFNGIVMTEKAYKSALRVKLKKDISKYLAKGGKITYIGKKTAKSSVVTQ
jgi:hypothetical protein